MDVTDELFKRLSKGTQEFLINLGDWASRGKTVRIYYNPKVTTKKPVYRTIEPYSLRMRNIHINGYDKPAVPTVVLFGFDPYKKTIKMFVVDRIKNFEFQSKKFTPQWSVEFKPKDDKMKESLCECALDVLEQKAFETFTQGGSEISWGGIGEIGTDLPYGQRVDGPGAGLPAGHNFKSEALAGDFQKEIENNFPDVAFEMDNNSIKNANKFNFYPTGEDKIGLVSWLKANMDKYGIRDLDVHAREGIELWIEESTTNRQLAVGLVEGGWAGSVKSSTNPPAGTFTKSAEQIASIMSRSSVSPKGLGSAIKMVQSYVNRMGKNADKYPKLGKQKKNCERAIKILQKKNAVQESEEKLTMAQWEVAVEELEEIYLNGHLTIPEYTARRKELKRRRDI